jgi:PAS domain S-box-containing protein
MKAQLEEPADAARKAEVLREALVAEDALRQREDYLRLTVDTIPVLAWCTRPDGWNEFLNQRWLDYTGLTIEEARGWGWKVAIHPDDLPRVLDVWQGLLVSGKSGELEARLRRADGVYRWFLFRVEPLRAPQGTIVKWYGTNTDIDDRKRAEALLTPC